MKNANGSSEDTKAPRPKVGQVIAQSVARTAERARAAWTRLNTFAQEHGPSRRGWIAMAMALVAMLGAGSAYASSHADLDATLCESNLAELRVYLLSQQQTLLDQTALYNRVVDNYNGRYPRLLQVLNFISPAHAATAQDNARELGLGSCPPAAGMLIAPSRGETTANGASTPASAPGKAKTSKGSSSNGPIIGLATETSAKIDPLVSRLADQVDALHRMSAGAALAAALFVVALVFLTLMDVFGDSWRPVFVLLIVTAVIAALVVGTAADAWLKTLYVRIALGFVLVGGLTWIVVDRIGNAQEEDEEPSEMVEFSKESFPAKGIHLGPGQRRANTYVVILIAAAAMFSALSGYGYALMLQRSAGMASKAADYQTQLLSLNAQEHSAAYAAIEQLFSRETSTPAAAARSGAAPSEKAAGSRPQKKSKLSEQLAADPFHLARVVYEDTVPEPAIKYVYWNSYNDLSIALHDKAAQYLSTLTLFAIALYLFGQSLAMGTARPGRVLIFFGLILLASGIYLGVSTMRQALPSEGTERPGLTCDVSDLGRIDERQDTTLGAAAACFAEGELNYQMAVVGDPHAARRAFDAYGLATLLRPMLVVAQYRAAEALAPHQALRVGEFNPARFDIETFEKMVDDKRSAIDSFFKQYKRTVPAVVLSDLGFDEFILAVAYPALDASKQRSLLDDSIQKTRAAIDLDLNDQRYGADVSDLRSTYFNLGAELLAEGHWAEASHAFEWGFARPTGAGQRDPGSEKEKTHFCTDLGAGCPTPSPTLSSAASISSADPVAPTSDAGVEAIRAIGNLEMLRDRCAHLGAVSGLDCSSLGRDVDLLESQIFGDAWKTALGPIGAFDGSAVTAAPTPGGLGWQVRGAMTPASPANRLVAFAYQFAPQWKMWYVLPDFSGQVAGSDIHQASGGYRGVLIDRSGLGQTLQGPASCFRIDWLYNGAKLAQPRTSGCTQPIAQPAGKTIQPVGNSTPNLGAGPRH